MRKITVTPYGSFSIHDVDGLEPQAPGTSQAHSIGFKATDAARSFNVTESAWDRRIREQLETLAIMRIPVNDGASPATRTMPVMTYTVEEIPAQRPRITQVQGTVGVAGGSSSLVLQGVNLIPGTQASVSVGSGTGLLTITAVRKGPAGNLITVEIAKGAASASVAVTVQPDGRVKIVVTPLAASAANAIAAQLAASALASVFVSATSGGAGKVVPTTLRLTGGSGSGTAHLIVPTSVATSFLKIDARKPGNGGNRITVKILAASGGGSVSVSGNDITVTPAAGGIGVDELATQINASAAAAALVVAAAQGTTDISPATVAKSYLLNGCGEDAVATVGGAAASITTHSDTSIALSVSAAALAAASVAENEQAVINLLTGHHRLQAQIAVGA